MRLSIIFLLLALLISCKENPKEQAESEQAISKKKIIVGYVPGFRGSLEGLSIDAKKLTHINYAFVDVQDSMAWLTNIETDTVNFKILNKLKVANPDLKILISIGGWTWSGNFSDATLTPSSRKKFAKTSVEIVANHNLDGVDIDWEYPGLIGDNNVFRPEDKQNYTLMFKEIRKELDELTKRTGKEYQLTTAVGAFKSYIEHTEMDKAAKYLDYVNLMTYDYYTVGDTAGHHSNLYPPEDYDKDASADKSFKEFLAAGVPAEKLVMGLPFYGRSWIMESADKHGINMPVKEGARGGGFSYIKDSLVNKKGFVRYWDKNAKAPYLFNSTTNQLIVYDDEESVKLKCEYVIDNNMGGVMFWQYASDPKEYLLDVVNENLYPKAQNVVDFTLPSATDNSHFTLSEANGKFVALHFLLKTECPYCIRHTSEYLEKASTLPDVLQIFIKPDTEEEIKDWATNIPDSDALKSPIYRDANAELASQYNIPDGYAFHGETVHYPALILLNKEGKEVFRYVGKDNSDRYSFEDLAAKIQELK